MQSRLVTDTFNNLSPASRRNLASCVADYGDDTRLLAEFYDRHLADVTLADVGQASVGTASVGNAVFTGRVQSFHGALGRYQSALVELNQYTRVGRVAASRRAELRRAVVSAYEDLNRHYAQEMRRIVPDTSRSRNRGNALSNAERGITLSERNRGRGIHIADMHEGRKVSRFADSLRYVGRGVIAVDIGVRGQKVRSAYHNDEQWLRELMAQGGGFGGAGVTGFATGRAAFLLGRIALASTPVGWVVLVGSTIAVGAIAAYQMDKAGQDAGHFVWDSLSLRR
ncbi:hypothetical protein [Marinimicrobium alkaliphilum]|uniref:hypothetical protein n=1 Tax=Marinimicrobium alkaliphilum TaxID=2202654 RepID=UPI000DB9FEAB|nr:hypothetical protein [Marinimicrobium alkaliphilum]